MTPEEQRIAIAEACGWKWKYIPTGHGMLGKVYSLRLVPGNTHQECEVETDPEQVALEIEMSHEEDSGSESLGIFGSSPDYLNDLNAMHEAIVSLPKDKRFQVAQMTTEIVLRRDDWACCEEDVWGLLASAEAHEWAEAFLRTLGLWKEDA
jgi:hypothetical protein